MPDIGRGGEEVNVEIGEEEEQPREEADREEAEIDALGLLGSYHDDDEEDDDHE